MCISGRAGFYKHFGFDHHDGLSYEGVPGKYLLAQSFNKENPTGEVKYHKVFGEYG